jgi:hypothetical protein
MSTRHLKKLLNKFKKSSNLTLEGLFSYKDEKCHRFYKGFCMCKAANLCMEEKELKHNLGKAQCELQKSV